MLPQTGPQAAISEQATQRALFPRWRGLQGEPRHRHATKILTAASLEIDTLPGTSKLHPFKRFRAKSKLGLCAKFLGNQIGEAPGSMVG
jgi:hypothetical protein